jgi:AcrR family transcriptional regulator
VDLVTASARTRLAVDVRREQLLDAGVELFAERPYEDVSIDEIAAACGVSRGLLYHYFGGKRDFFVASIRHASERLREAEPDPALPALEQLRQGLRRYFESVAERSGAHAALRQVAAGDPEIAAIIEERRQAFVQRVLAGIPGAGGESPLMGITARSWIGSVEVATLEWIERRDIELDELVEILAQSLIAATLAAARLDPAIKLPPDVADHREGLS